MSKEDEGYSDEKYFLGWCVTCITSEATSKEAVTAILVKDASSKKKQSKLKQKTIKKPMRSQRQQAAPLRIKMYTLFLASRIVVSRYQSLAPV